MDNGPAERLDELASNDSTVGAWPDSMAPWNDRHIEDVGNGIWNDVLAVESAPCVHFPLNRGYGEVTLIL